ncbi:LOW QUALITY PROTEIN: zinc finger CCCH domain-containing protein 14 [Sphaerodactylus townsendi]|uniref:LOW QUALITY PROTEIN: zinc finger CCCH domain-containing protein 14 n=1 Tax=Sphaerodactylus townsendi TaxID=933632 RepID=UPI0020260F54|nr:LOW QUALITY PROTEIN: zinc finger CCCH domain-containing protein 14 [Sphaerodactylus townsendi]
MEIGTEISRKIRSAIKGKLQELGAYVDEELPDYIMVMVANKKSQEQMTEDLSLFLGNSTVRFTVWLHGVLDKLRSVTTEPPSLKTSESNIFENSLSLDKSTSGGGEERRGDEILQPLAVSSSRPERTDARVSTSNQEQRLVAARQSCQEGSTSLLMSTVKPLRELSPSEAVIDIKPEPDDLIDDDLNFVQENRLPRKKPLVTLTYGSSRPSVEIYRPPPSRSAEGSVLLQRLPQQSNAQTVKLLQPQGIRSLEALPLCEPGAFGGLAESCRPPPRVIADKISSEEENFRKRKLPVVSSVVRVKRFSNEGGEEEEEEEEEEDYGLRLGGISSSVSVPAKPERRPSLPPSKQANKNLILKAISEAQESVTKTTNYATVPPKQTVPVAPRTRTSHDEALLEMMNIQNRPSRVDIQIQEEEPKEQALGRVPGTQQRQLFSRLQIEPGIEATLQKTPDYYELESMVHTDTRSFILKKPKLAEEIAVPQNLEVGKRTTRVSLQALGLKLIRRQEQLLQPEKPASPKFIVTLDGVPSPPGYLSDQEEEEVSLMEGVRPVPPKASASKGLRSLRAQQVHIISRQLESADVEMEEMAILQKAEKVPERCKYWPACKNGDECAFHHPTLPCKAFPNCKFADKCLFIHPNCKYDAKCSKPDCPYTHASRRTPLPPSKPAPPPVPPASSTSQLCRFFPACKKMECPFYHPKHCRFNTQCTRVDCTFYHPTVSVPPRHALKWTRTQTSE